MALNKNGKIIFATFQEKIDQPLTSSPPPPPTELPQNIEFPPSFCSSH